MARPVFLSYAWEDEAVADRLESELRLRGVPVWRDRRGMRWGTYNEETVLDAIEQRCSAFVLLLTDAVMTSGFILQIELPAMARRRTADPSFFAGAVFARDSGIQKSAAELHAASRVELASPLGSPVSGEDEEADLRRAANAILTSYLASALRDDEQPTARIETRSAVPEADPTHLHLTWSPPLATDVDGYDADVWHRQLLPALADVRAALEEATRARVLSITGRPHISAAMAVGFEFRAPTGWQLQLGQPDLDVLTARVEPSADGWTTVRQPCASGEDRRLVLCLHAAKDVTRAMQEHCRELPPARVELHVRPASGPGHVSVRGSAANALAASIAAEIAQARTQFGTQETHLYLACPWSLAAALGWHLSSSGRLVSHEADVERSSYRAACELA